MNTELLDAFNKQINQEFYNENGVLETFELPNRAKDRMTVLQGKGEPERVQSAGAGVLYLDVLTSNVWVKTTDTGNTGWVMIYTPANFLEGREYLTPDGDGSALKGISVGNISGGIVNVRMGGTGTQSITGIVKGRGGDLPFVPAKPGKDYLEPKTFIGSLGLFMVSDSYSLPEGWLPCDGSIVTIDYYPELYNYLKYIYPNKDILANNGYYYDEVGNKITVNSGDMVLPDFRNRYIRGYDGKGIINVGDPSDDHLPNIKAEGFLWRTGKGYDGQLTGAAYVDRSVSRKLLDVNDGSTGNNGSLVKFDASRCSDIYKNNVKEVKVKDIAVQICIYAGLREEPDNEV